MNTADSYSPGAHTEYHPKQSMTRTWSDASTMATLPNIGGDLCKSSVILFPVQRHKVWLTPAAGVPCTNYANIGEHITV